MNVREARDSDADRIVDLVNQLGYSATSDLIHLKLNEFKNRSYDEVYVAEDDGEVKGCISCHITSLFHQKGVSGRITSLVIDDGCRGKGIGRALVEKAEDYFRSEDCIKSEVTSGDHRPEAHAFYQACGYKLDERRFLKIYS